VGIHHRRLVPDALDPACIFIANSVWKTLQRFNMAVNPNDDTEL
jgi:hypothetical protein